MHLEVIFIRMVAGFFFSVFSLFLNISSFSKTNFLCVRKADYIYTYYSISNRYHGTISSQCILKLHVFGPTFYYFFWFARGIFKNLVIFAISNILFQSHEFVRDLESFVMAATNSHVA